METKERKRYVSKSYKKKADFDKEIKFNEIIKSNDILKTNMISISDKDDSNLVIIFEEGVCDLSIF
jgi:hypothetical protein